ncbi:MAG: hypothetical protein QOK35_452 [Pseudonocardiales bacterium]|nr:hypothetical protein [Pseudonocardiales bacterium]
MSTSADSTTRRDVRAAAELSRDVDTDAVADANDLRDTSIVDDPADGRSELPLEADPADVADQDAVVPYDDEER